MIAPLLVLLGLILIFSIADFYELDAIWFLFLCISAGLASYVITLAPVQLTWWAIRKLIGE